MTPSTALWAVLAFVFLLNLPFGFWRAGVRRFSKPWFVAVHAPVPFVVGFRLLLGVGWRLPLVPLLVATYFAGQFVGGMIRRGRSSAVEKADSSWGE